MLYSKTCEYAIRALTYMAHKPEGEFSQIKEIAAKEELPQHFLSKVLQSLVRYNIVISARGPTGGFALAKPKDRISLKDIVFAVDGEDIYERCAVGLAECLDEDPCPLHEMWSYLRGQIIDYLEITTLQTMTSATDFKKEHLPKAVQR